MSDCVPAPASLTDDDTSPMSDSVPAPASLTDDDVCGEGRLVHAEGPDPQVVHLLHARYPLQQRLQLLDVDSLRNACRRKHSHASDRLTAVFGTASDQASREPADCTRGSLIGDMIDDSASRLQVT